MCLWDVHLLVVYVTLGKCHNNIDCQKGVQKDRVYYANERNFETESRCAEVRTKLPKANLE